METLKRIGRFCGTLCTLVVTLVTAIATMAVTNALSPVEFKEKIVSSADRLVNLATEQLVTSGVPETYADMVRANIGVEQFVAMLYMTAIGVLGAILWFVVGSIWARLFPGRALPKAKLQELTQGSAEPA